MNFEQDLTGWDGKSLSDIEAIYDRYYASDDFIQNIIKFTGVETLQKGATWLLKHHFENGNKINKSQVLSIFEQLHKMIDWESKLHILQCLSYMKIVESKKKEVEFFLRNNLTDENKFVRAWAYNGFYELSMQHPEYMKETKQFFEMAMLDEVASVKARIRNIRKKGL